MSSKQKFKPGIYNLKVKRSKTGLGLFTFEPIQKGACIIEYTGRVVVGEEVYTSKSKYLLEISKTKTIDGSNRKNIARYINHSCVPNSELDTHKGKAYILAIKNIKAGEELTYNYGKEYFDEFLKPVGCKCPKHSR